MTAENGSASSVSTGPRDPERRASTGAVGFVGEPSAHLAVSVTVLGGLDEIDAEFLERFGARVESSDVRSQEEDGGLVHLSFVHRSTDLWTTLLTTMHASWTAGFEPVEVTARVVEA